MAQLLLLILEWFRAPPPATFLQEEDEEKAVEGDDVEQVKGYDEMLLQDEVERERALLAASTPLEVSTTTEARMRQFS